jgi:hypothetical protein
MMKRLEGRNLKHPGCLIGITLGLTIGIVLAGGLAWTSIPFGTLLWIWLGLTVVLGAIGWFIGNRISASTSAVNGEEEGTIEQTSELPTD